MAVDPASLALKLAPKIAPLGKHGVRVLLGLNDYVRLLALVKADIKRSGLIAHGKHDVVWKAVDRQRQDPEIAGCLTAYLMRGDIAAARARLHVRLGELLCFDDPAIDDAAIVTLVAGSIEDNLSRAPLKDRDAMRLELALTRAAIGELADRVSATGEGRGVALEPALVPVGANVSSPARLVRARAGVVPYAARADALSELVAWTRDRAAFGVCVVGGRGGSGKTRLGVELARHTSRAGWLGGMLITDASPAAIDALVRIDAHRLIVVDYAENRAEQLEVLLPWLAATATAQHPVRVLLLIRTAPRHGSDWTTLLRHRSDALDAVLDDVQRCLLEDVPLQLVERDALFTAAATVFASRDGDEPSARAIVAQLSAGACQAR